VSIRHCHIEKFGNSNITCQEPKKAKIGLNLSKDRAMHKGDDPSF
jgi:hypothetical protein